MNDWYRFRKWFDGLYRVQQCLFILFICVIMFMLFKWVTHMPSERKQNFPIKLGVKYERY